jgi:hypothetical protein
MRMVERMVTEQPDPAFPVQAVKHYAKDIYRITNYQPL